MKPLEVLPNKKPQLIAMLEGLLNAPAPENDDEAENDENDDEGDDKNDDEEDA